MNRVVLLIGSRGMLSHPSLLGKWTSGKLKKNIVAPAMLL